jgi:cytochrome P450
LIGGHDTTSTTLCWGLKYLTDNPDAQLRFRFELREAFASAAAEHRYPTAKEIINTHNPYLDAVIEEVARLSGSTAGIIRNALVDTTVLGHYIPKGTDVFLMSNGPDCISPSFPVNDANRSEGARSIKGRQVGSWSGDAAEMQAFKPERWLVTDEAGNEKFDATAGPHLAFGLGPRGCFGRRLAYLEMRLMLVMIIWTFELKKCPEELSGYSKTDKLTVKPNQFFLRLQKVTI